MVGGVVTNLGEVSGVSAPCNVTGGAINFYFFWKVAPSKKHMKGGNLCHKTLWFLSRPLTVSVSLSSSLCVSLSLSEIQDDLEAITNEIKKAANNARNKLKSREFSYLYCCIIMGYCVPKNQAQFTHCVLLCARRYWASAGVKHRRESLGWSADT